MGTVEGLLDEHFVPIAGFEKYSISNYGRVIRTFDGYELKIAPLTFTGQLMARLSVEGVRGSFPIRKLVAAAFFADYTPGSEVYFINGDRNDCSVMNLTLARPSEAPKKVPYRVRFAVRINETGVEYASMTAAAEAIDGNAGGIQKCLMGLKKTYKGYTFSRVE